MNTFIRAVEVWLPDSDGQLLELGDGLYGGAGAFGMISRTMCFGRGEGLPGRVWEQGAPVLMKDLQGGQFRRAAAARKAGLVCAAAMPIFVGDAFKAVLVFFCGGDDARGSAVELSRVAGELDNPGDQGQLVDAYVFPSPWASGDAADAASKGHVVSIPCGLPSSDSYSLSFAEGPAASFALRVESWLRPASGKLELASTQVAIQSSTVSAASAESAVGKAFDTGIPAFVQPNYATGERPVDVNAGFGGMVAVSVGGKGAAERVMAIYFS